MEAEPAARDGAARTIPPPQQHAPRPHFERVISILQMSVHTHTDLSIPESKWQAAQLCANSYKGCEDMSLLEDPAVPHTKSMGVQREMSHFPALLPPVEAKQATNPTELILNQDLHLFKRKERKKNHGWVWRECCQLCRRKRIKSGQCLLPCHHKLYKTPLYAHTKTYLMPVKRSSI